MFVSTGCLKEANSAPMDVLRAESMALLFINLDFLITIEVKEINPAPFDIETVDGRRENGILIRIVRAVKFTKT